MARPGRGCWRARTHTARTRSSLQRSPYHSRRYSLLPSSSPRFYTQHCIQLCSHSISSQQHVASSVHCRDKHKWTPPSAPTHGPCAPTSRIPRRLLTTRRFLPRTPSPTSTVCCIRRHLHERTYATACAVAAAPWPPRLPHLFRTPSLWLPTTDVQGSRTRRPIPPILQRPRPPSQTS